MSKSLKWTIISIIVGIIGVIISYLLTTNLWVSLTIGVVISLLLIYNNPHTRYARAARWLSFAYIGANGITFLVEGKIETLNFMVGLRDSWLFNLITAVLIGFLYVLDFLENNDGKITIFGIHLFNINSNNRTFTTSDKSQGNMNQGDVKGDLTQSYTVTAPINTQNFLNVNLGDIGGNLTQIIKIIQTSQNLLEEFNKLKTERNELSILAKYSDGNYNSKIKEVDFKIQRKIEEYENFLKEMKKISPNETIAKLMEEAGNVLINGRGSLDEILIEIQQEKQRISVL